MSVKVRVKLTGTDPNGYGKLSIKLTPSAPLQSVKMTGSDGKNECKGDGRVRTSERKGKISEV